MKSLALMFFLCQSSAVYGPDYEEVRDLQRRFPGVMDCCLLAVVNLSQEIHELRCVGYEHGRRPWHRFQQHGFSESQLRQCIRLVHGLLDQPVKLNRFNKLQLGLELVNQLQPLLLISV